MFKKLLIANRGEIAVRVIRACRVMGIVTLALYEPHDRNSLHVRLADECVLLNSPQGFFDAAAILQIAKAHAVDALYPGYGFLAEREDFIRQCEGEGIAFIGPPARVVELTRHKAEMLKRVQEAGFSTPPFVDVCSLTNVREMEVEAERLGYPLVVKSCRGGHGERLVWSAARLRRAVRRAQAESQAVYGERQVYLEKAILPAHQIGVQIIADREGRMIHLGERESSLMYGNQKVIEESPAPCLSPALRSQLWETALAIARLAGGEAGRYENIGTVEFLVDLQGQFYFTEMKPCIQIEHPLSEALTRVDLAKEQIRIAAGESLRWQQKDIDLSGWAIQCRVNAEDPWQGFMPSAGKLTQVRLPGGPEVRVDTYLYSGCDIPAEYDPLIAKVIVWAENRSMAVERMRHALQEFQLTGVATNLPLVQRMLELPGFVQGNYSVFPSTGSVDAAGAITTQADTDRAAAEKSHLRRDLAVIAAMIHDRRNQVFQPVAAPRLNSGWHRDCRRLP